MNKEPCNTKCDFPHVYLIATDTDYFQVRLNMKLDSWPYLLKWWGSDNISGFDWKINIIG